MRIDSPVSKNSDSPDPPRESVPAIFAMDIYISVLWVTSQYRVVIAFVPGRVLDTVEEVRAL